MPYGLYRYLDQKPSKSLYTQIVEQLNSIQDIVAEEEKRGHDERWLPGSQV